jgi:hypothetical protein
MSIGEVNDGNEFVFESDANEHEYKQEQEQEKEQEQETRTRTRKKDKPQPSHTRSATNFSKRMTNLARSAENQKVFITPYAMV